jgi:hypothetical protein
MLEVFAIGEEVEELEGVFVGMRDERLELLVVKLVGKGVFAGASAFDLDEFRG